MKLKITRSFNKQKSVPVFAKKQKNINILIIYLLKFYIFSLFLYTRPAKQMKLIKDRLYYTKSLTV